MKADAGIYQDGWGRVLRYAVFGPMLGTYIVVGMLLLLRPNALSWHLILVVIFTPVIAGPVGYFLGLLPAVVVGMIDRLLQRRQVGAVWRLPVVMALGFAFSYPIAKWFLPQSITPSWLPGLTGGGAALLCFIWCDFFSRSRQ